MKKHKIITNIIVLFLIQISYTYDCPEGKTKNTIIKEIESGSMSNAFLEIEVNSTLDSSETVLSNLRNMVINKIMKDSTFSSIYLIAPVEIKDSSMKLIIDLKTVEEIKTSSKALGMLAGGVVGGVLSGKGVIGIQVRIVKSNNNDEVVGSAIMSAQTTGGISWGKIPYQSIECVSKTTADFIAKGN